jgi:hypothetical protein
MKRNHLALSLKLVLTSLVFIAGWRDWSQTWNEFQRQWIPRFRSPQNPKNEHAHEEFSSKVESMFIWMLRILGFGGQLFEKDLTRRVTGSSEKEVEWSDHTIQLWKHTQILYSLFFIVGLVLGGRVTVTDGDRRWITIMNISLHNSIYQL